MGTRSRVGLMQKDGTVKHSYVHYDGYVDGVGITLAHHYGKIDKVEELLSFGNMSFLAQKVHPDGIHNFENPENGVTVFYNRDRGKSNVDAQVTTMEEFESVKFTTCIDYLYLFSEGKWFVKSLIDNSGWKLVTDSLLELSLMQ
jgi:hypothetical protein